MNEPGIRMGVVLERERMKVFKIGRCEDGRGWAAGWGLCCLRELRESGGNAGEVIRLQDGGAGKEQNLRMGVVEVRMGASRMEWTVQRACLRMRAVLNL